MGFGSFPEPEFEPLEAGWHRVEQLLREALAGRTGEQMGALARGDANHREVRAPGGRGRPDSYVIPTPSAEVRAGACSDRTNTPPTGQRSSRR